MSAEYQGETPPLPQTDQAPTRRSVSIRTIATATMSLVGTLVGVFVSLRTGVPLGVTIPAGAGGGGLAGLIIGSDTNPSARVELRTPSFFQKRRGRATGP